MIYDKDLSYRAVSRDKTDECMLIIMPVMYMEMHTPFTNIYIFVSKYEVGFVHIFSGSAMD